MEILLGKVTQQAMNYAIRSGITITASYAIQQSTRLLNNVEETKEKDDLRTLQERLGSKMQIVSPAIDMIELISARGNTTLESAVALTKSLRSDIQLMGQRLEAVSRGAESRSTSAAAKARSSAELKTVLVQMRQLLSRIDDAVPLINLAITTSGASLSTALPSTVSPSRLLQASTFLTAGDTQYSSEEFESVQIGPTFTLSLYMLFSSHLRPQNEEEMRHTTWKEVIRKARVKLVRVPVSAIYEAPQPGIGVRNERSEMSGHDQSKDEGRSHMAAEVRSDEFAYQMLIVEDLDDSLMHDFEGDEPRPMRYDDVAEAGILESIPIHEISKIFYADTGKILNIGSDEETNSPILLLKRDLDAYPPRRMVERWTEDQEPEPERLRGRSANGVDEAPDNNGQAEIDAQLERERTESPPAVEDQLALKHSNRRIPPDLDPEWLAFEVFVENDGSETESEPEALSPRPDPSREASLDPELTNSLSHLRLGTDSAPHTPASPSNRQLMRLRSPSSNASSPTGGNFPAIRTSLSLLETLLRLLSLQQFQQASHLAISDELLHFFLSEAATTGAATGDEASRRRLRTEARQRVGFDPYDESPIKRRGEDYQYRGGRSQAGWENGDGAGAEQPWPEDEQDSPRSPLLLRDRASSSRTGSTPPRRPSPGLPRSPGALWGRRSIRSPRTPSALGNPPARAEERVSSPLAKSAPMMDEGVVLTSETPKQEREKPEQ